MPVLKVLAEDVDQLSDGDAGPANLGQADGRQIRLLELPHDAEQLQGKRHRPQTPLCKAIVSANESRTEWPHTVVLFDSSREAEAVLRIADEIGDAAAALVDQDAAENGARDWASVGHDDDLDLRLDPQRALEIVPVARVSLDKFSDRDLGVELVSDASKGRRHIA